MYYFLPIFPKNYKFPKIQNFREFPINFQKSLIKNPENRENYSVAFNNSRKSNIIYNVSHFLFFCCKSKCRHCNR